MLAIIGASGKLGGATLSAILTHKLLDAKHIVALTSSQPGSATWNQLEAKGVNVRHASFDDATSLEYALTGCERFFLVSTPQISLDFNDAPTGSGREKAHIRAIDAAKKAGVRHIYYSSLAFANPSKAGVMRAHIRTEAYLESLASTSFRATIIREGLYNESWPLYLGRYNAAADNRNVIPLNGDGKICWTAIEDLGLGNAAILAAPSDSYTGRTIYLSTSPATALDMQEVAELVSRARGGGQKVEVQLVSRDEQERHVIDYCGISRPEAEWWSSTYEALKDGECLIDDQTLTQLLERHGRVAIPMAQTVAAMMIQP